RSVDDLTVFHAAYQLGRGYQLLHERRVATNPFSDGDHHNITIFDESLPQRTEKSADADGGSRPHAHSDLVGGNTRHVNRELLWKTEDLAIGVAHGPRDMRVRVRIARGQSGDLRLGVFYGLVGVWPSFWEALGLCLAPSVCHRRTLVRLHEQQTWEFVGKLRFLQLLRPLVDTQ